ncbi:MAG: radical SAM protein [Candidatus Omnitrophica bacterium]|nr:radical SAM protein [Candidatus Omnitrophota bacterium]MBU1926044.1 radical SAM protein [Candidatus Omnitrophota bacterium]
MIDAMRIFKKKSNPAKHPLLAKMRALQVEVSNNCNLSCSICWRALRKEKRAVSYVSRQQFQKVLDEFSALLPLKELNAQGLGEPFLCPDIIEILKQAKAKGLIAWLVSNGTLIDEFVAGALVDMGLDKIRISIDTADAQLYRNIKVNSDLKRVRENVSRISRAKQNANKNTPVIALNTVVLKRTLPGISQLIDLSGQCGIEEITLIPLVNFSRGLAVPEEQVDFTSGEFQAKFAALKGEAQTKHIELNLGISLETKDSKYCHYGLYMDASGSVYPCCNMPGVGLGNIFKQKASAVVKKYIIFRNWLDRQEINCSSCASAVANAGLFGKWI